MSHRRSYTDDELSRILQDEEVMDFSDGSDDLYEPDEDELSSASETIEDISRLVQEASNDAPLSLESPVADAIEEQGNLSLDQQWSMDILPLAREIFTGNSGLQNIQAVTNEDGTLAIVKIMNYFISDELIDVMVDKTNSYAEIFKLSHNKPFSRIARWTNIDRQEMKKFFAIILIMGIDKKPTIEHYWKLDPLYFSPLMHNISMSYNRFSNILRCWHFEDVQPNNRDPLYRIQPLIDQIISKFRELYIPGDTIVVDESQINHQGRLHIKTYNPQKAHKYGIKVYKMCSTNSYTWSYAIHAGSSTAIEGLDKPGSVVVKLCEPLFDTGRLIIVDNYYTSLPLAKYLKDHHTDLCGTLRKNKRGLPQDVIQKRLRRGEVIARQADNFITVLKWHDKRDVLMITTCHDHEMTDVSSWRGVTPKPNAIIDYNHAKKGIDVADQLGSYYSPLRKSLTWYKKIAYDLLFQAAIVNTRVIYNEYSTSSTTVLAIQETMIRYWLGEENNRIIRPPRISFTGQHYLTEIPRKDGKLIRRRCVSCYANKKNDGVNPLTAKLVNTECLTCQKCFCLPCFNAAHK